MAALTGGNNMDINVYNLRNLMCFPISFADKEGPTLNR